MKQVLKLLTPLVFLAIYSSTAIAADARSTPPAWGWGAGKMQVQFDIDTGSCTRVKVPVGGDTVSSGAKGENCPVNSVAHGYYFGKKKKTIYKDPPKYTSYQYCRKTYRTDGGHGTSSCPSSWSGRERNPTTGKYWDRYTYVKRTRYSCEPMWHTPRGGTVYLCEETWRYKKFRYFPSSTTYTVDEDKIYTNCCRMKIH